MFKRYRFVALMLCVCVFSCSIVGTACTDDVEFKVYAKQLILNGSINMAFYVPLGTDELNNSTEGTTFSINGKETKDWTFNKNECLTGHIDTTNGESKFVEGSEETDTVKLYAFLVELTSVQMNDPIIGTIQVGNKTGTVESYTVKDYLDTLTKAENQYPDKTVALANALKDYGHYAQITLSETNTTDYTAANHVAMPNAAGKVTTDSSYTGSNEYNAIYDSTTLNTAKTYSANTQFTYSITSGLTGKDSKTIGYTIELDSKTNLVITNLPDGATIGDITVTQETGDDAPESPTLKNEDNELSIADISAHELGYQYEIPVNTNYTIKVSPMSYINYILNATTEQFTNMGLTGNHPVHLQNAVLALYNYYKAERDYRGNDITNR